MRGSWKIARAAGIDVFMHWTFLLLLGWIGVSYYLPESNWMHAVSGILFVLAIFGCVVLHELGHALTARRFGIQTRDITLLPIGGVARLERMPDKPWQEFLVAIAGPAVNVVIAGLLLAVVLVTTGFSGIVPESLFGGAFLANLLWVNVALVVFNLLPAFPMDGGRVLRALLATRLSYLQATNIAASVGQVMAVIFGLLGLFGSPLLIFIGIFIFLGARAEAQMAQVKSLLAGLRVQAAMMFRFRTLRADDQLGQAAHELLSGHQDAFPVLDDGRVVGVLRRQDIVAGLNAGESAAPVSRAMRTDIPEVHEDDLLEPVAQRMQEAGFPALPVTHDGDLIGLVSLENVSELMMIRAAQQNGNTLHGPQRLAS